MQRGEGEEGREKVGGSLAFGNSGFALIRIPKFRHSCEMNLLWVWVEQRAEHMGSQRPSISSHYSFFQVLLISYLHIV